MLQEYREGLLYDEEGRLCFGESKFLVEDLALEFGTPLYVYSASLIQGALREFYGALKSQAGGRSFLICYSVKANSNLSILRLIQKEGAGADIVSAGELHRCRKAGIDPQKIVFSGVGKSPEELEYGLKEGILLFSVESADELFLLDKLARRHGIQARVSLRINPDLTASTHPYISTGGRKDKFGIPSEEILDISLRFREKCQEKDREKSQKKSQDSKGDTGGVEICGLGFHIGSQILDTSSFEQAATILCELRSSLQKSGFSIRYLDVGGGIGIRYKDEKTPAIKDYLTCLFRKLPQDADLNLLFEPGRFIIGNAGILITKILLSKNNRGNKIYVCDAAMNDLMRPALYQSYHEILAHRKERGKCNSSLVGPICESGDFFANERLLPSFEQGDYAAICSCGAYGFSMSSNYNSRLRLAEVLIQGNKAKLIRQRERYEDLLSLEESCMF